MYEFTAITQHVKQNTTYAERVHLLAQNASYFKLADLQRSYTTACVEGIVEGPFSLLEGLRHCRFCGAVVACVERRIERHRRTKHKYWESFVDTRRSLGVDRLYECCYDKRCRALATYKPAWRCPSTEHRLLRTLLEVLKNDGNNPDKRRLEKHFVRHAR